MSTWDHNNSTFVQINQAGQITTFYKMRKNTFPLLE